MTDDTCDKRYYEGGTSIMPMLRLKRWPGQVLQTHRAGIYGAVVIAALLMVMCGTLRADVELPALNSAEPTTFQGEIAKGLKIEMKLYRKGPSLYGAYVYEAFGRDIQVKGTVNERGEIALQEFVKGKATGHFQGKFVSKSRIEGKWYRKANDKGRSFYLVGTEAPLAVPATQVLATAKPVKGDREASPAVKEERSVPRRAEATVTTAATVESRIQTPPSAKQQTAPVPREIVPALQESKTEAKAQPVQRAIAPQQPPLRDEPSQSPSKEQPALRPVVAEEIPKALATTEAQPAEKPRVEGRSVEPVRKKSSFPWTITLVNMKVAGAVGGILMLGFGLAWLAIVAGGAAGFRDNSALFRKVHAMGLSFLPGVVLLALGVGAVLAVFVE